MSKFVDERVVEMSFDNKHFEKNVKTSMGTIDELKNSLDFSGTANSINKEFDSISTGGLSSAIMGAKSSFTAFEIASIAAIANITNRVIDLGIQMVKSLSIDNISTGWAMYAESAISEATLLAQGFEQADVTETLEKLLWYSDETSYSFTDMVDNMSKFTASGQGLEESSKAMMGIANWAALSGQNAGVASRAMYQLSQAMSTGAVRLMDYKSIQTANMDTKEFRETVLNTAVALGQLSQNVDGTYTTMTGKTFNTGQFTTELDELWFTSEVLMKSLDKYSSGSEKLYEKISEDSSINTASQAIEKYGDELGEFELKAFLAAQEARTFKDAIVAVKDAVASGWMNIFSQIFGSVAEAKILWSDLANSLYDVFMDGMWKKIDILSIWSENNGRDDLFANTEENTGAFWNLFNALVAIKDLIGGAWQQVFGFSDLEEYDDQINDIATKLKTFTENLKEWSEGLVMSSETTEVLTNILTGLFSILKIVGRTIIAVAKGFSPLLEVLKPALGYLLGALGLVGKEITQFSETTNVFEKITENLRLFFTTVIDFVESLELLKGVKTFIKYFRESLNKVFGDTDKNSGKLISFKTVIESIVNVLKWFGEIISKYVVPFLSKFFKVLGPRLGWIVGNIIKLAVSIKGIVIGFIEWLKTNERIQNGFLKLKNVLDVVGETFKKVIKNIAEFFKSFGNSDMAPVEEFSGEIEEKFTPLKTFVEGLSNLFQGLWHVIKAIVPVVGALFSFIGKALKFVGDKLKSIFTSGDGEVNFAKLFTVGFWAVVAVGIYRFADMLRSITSVFRDAFDSVFDYFNSKAMMQYMEAIKTMAISILLMVGALLILGSMDTGALTKSMVALGVLMGFMVGVLLLMKNLTAFEVSGSLKDMLYKGSKIAEIGSAFAGIAIAILILAYSLKMISQLDPEKMMYSLGIIAVMMGMMIGVMKLVGQSEKGVNKAVKSMVKVAISVSLLAKPLKVIGSIDTDTGIRGLIGIASLMAILVLYSRFSKPIEKSQKPIHGMLTTALALTLLIIPLKVIGSMDWISLGKSFAAIGALFGILVIVSKLLKLKDTNRLKALSWQLVKVSLGLAVFGIAMLIINLNGWESIVKSLVALGLVFIILSVISKTLTAPRVKNLDSIVKSLVPLSFALIIFGIAMQSIGANTWETIFKVIITLSFIFYALSKLGKTLTAPRVKNLLNTAWMLIPLSVSLATFGVSMKIIGSIPWEKIAAALITIGAIFGMLALFDKVLKSTGSSPWAMIAMGGALVILSFGLIVMSAALLALGSIPLETLAIGLGAIAATLVILGLAAWALTASDAIFAIIGLAISFAVFSVSIFLLVVALTMLVGIMTVSAEAFAAGMIAISTAIIIAAPTIMAALWAIVEGILMIVLKSIPLVVGALTTLILEILKAINTIIPPLMETITNLLVGILQTLETIIPQVIQTLLTLLNQLLEAIVTIFPTIINTLVTLFMQLFDALITNVPIFVNKLVDLFVTLLRSLSARLPEVMIEMALFIAAFVDGAVAALVLLYPRMINAGFDLIIGLLDGIGTAVKERAPELREAIKEFCKNIWEAILLFFGINSPSTKMMSVAGNLIAGLLKGLWDGLSKLIGDIGKWAGKVMGEIGKVFGKAWNFGKDLINGIGNGAKSAWSGVSSWFSGTAKNIGSFFSSSISNMRNIGSDLIGGLKNGMQTAGANIKSTVENVAGKVTGWFKGVFGINSPSKVFAEMGMFLDLGLAKGIKDHSDSAYDAAQGLGDDTAEGMEKSGLSKVLTDLNKSLESDFDNEVVIRPVLDLSEIQNGKGRLSSMMSDIDSYDISGSNSIASRTRDEINRDSKKLSDVTKGGSQQEAGSSEVINNTFNITGANAKDIADEVSRVLQIQVDRRKAKWAL